MTTKTRKPRKGEWTPEQDAIALSGRPYKVIAREVGRSPVAVAKRLRLLRAQRQTQAAQP